MSKEEMLEKIYECISGQGNQVDVGSVLTDLLVSLTNSAVAIEVADIAQIPSEVLDRLKCGEKIVVREGSTSRLYVVSYKKDILGGDIRLTCVSSADNLTVSYVKTEDGWVYIGTGGDFNNDFSSDFSKL